MESTMAKLIQAISNLFTRGQDDSLDIETVKRMARGIATTHPDEIGCNLCFEACPVEDALIEVETTRNRKKVTIPQVVPEHCIGCGACESVCPVEGELAIKVFAPGRVPETEVAWRR